jgi:hypothetical protein
MLATTAALLMGVGFVAFVLGAVFQYQGVAVIGAVLILGVGAVVTVSGVEHRSGEVVTTQPDNSTVHDFQYERTETPQNLSLGTLLMLLGGVLALRSLNDIGPGGRS